MPGDAVIILRLLLASVLGGLIGLEREVHGREAGIRTYLLVSLGSALIMVLSEYLFFKHPGTVPDGLLRADPGRIAAQAITGIGFLGAGVIIRYKNSIRGLTTAACMWVACTIGLAIGAGFYLYGAVGSAITLVALAGLKGFGRRLSTDWYRDLVVGCDEKEGQFELVEEVVGRYGVKVTSFSLRRDRVRQETLINLRLRFRSPQPMDQTILNAVYMVPGVRWVELK